MSVEVLDGHASQMFSNKLRIDLSAKVSDRVSFGGNFDYITYHGRTRYYLTDYLPESVLAPIPEDSWDSYFIDFSDRNFLDNAYIRIEFDRFDLTAGKLQISPGTGYAWNPTDMYNVKDILDPTYEQPGHNAIRADIPIGLTGNATVLYEPEEDFERSGKFASVKIHAGHFDLSVTGGERHVTLSDFASGEITLERRRMIGGDFSGELIGLGVWGEAAWNYMSVSEDYFEGLVGADYTFESGLYLLNEIYLNERGKPDFEDYSFNDWMRYLTSERKAVCRSTWHSMAVYPATDLLTIGGAVFTSVSDGSLVLVPSVEYNASNNLDVTFLGNFYIGEEGKAFSSTLGQGGLLRLRYYF
jgi:hypothetical protein